MSDILTSLQIASSKDTAPFQLNNINLTLSPGMTLETIIAQLQKYTEKHLYVINGGEVRYCSDLSSIKPINDAKSHDISGEHYIYQREECVCCLTTALRNKLMGIEYLDITPPKDQLQPTLIKYSL